MRDQTLSICRGEHSPSRDQGLHEVLVQLFGLAENDRVKMKSSSAQGALTPAVGACDSASKVAATACIKQGKNDSRPLVDGDRHHSRMMTSPGRSLVQGDDTAGEHLRKRDYIEASSTAVKRNMDSDRDDKKLSRIGAAALKSEWMDAEEAVDTNEEQEEEDVEEEEEVKTRSFEDLRNQCYICADALNFEDEQTCYYHTHSHPNLGVPVCSECHETVRKAKTRAEEASEEDKDLDFCVSCGRREDEFDGTILLCDSCASTVCQDCVALALGSFEHAKALVDADDEWHCLVCDVPHRIKLLQEVCLVRLQSQNNMTLEDLEEEIAFVEEEAQAWENKTSDEAKQVERQLLRRDLEKNGTFSEEKLEELLADTMNTRLRHCNRLSDRLTFLRGALEASNARDRMTMSLVAQLLTHFE